MFVSCNQQSIPEHATPLQKTRIKALPWTLAAAQPLCPATSRDPMGEPSPTPAPPAPPAPSAALTSSQQDQLSSLVQQKTN